MGKKTSQRFVVTAAQRNAGVHGHFYEGLQRITDDRSADLIVVPIQGRTIHDEDLADELTGHQIVDNGKQLPLNKKIQIRNFNVLPQQIDPVTSLERQTQHDVTTIFGSPKQRMKVIPNSIETLPKVLMTTGAVTRPRYRDDRRGQIAAGDHTYGAIIVETEGDIPYHFRQIRANKDGQFVDLGWSYDGDKDPTRATLDALVLGDIHVGDTDPKVRAATYEMVAQLRPRRIVLHDFFNGHSVNHHEEEKRVTRAQDYEIGRTSLERELKDVAAELAALIEATPRSTEIVVVAANHHEFLNKYLEKGEYPKDRENYRIAHQIALAMLDGEDPVEFGVRHFYDGEVPGRVRFLRRDEDYKVRGIQLGAHGDKGGNGARSSTVAQEKSYGPSISGDCHTPEILRNTYRVGTSTKLRLRYNVGPSSWLQTHGLLYDTGKVQLVNVIDGKWHGKDWEAPYK